MNSLSNGRYELEHELGDNDSDEPTEMMPYDRAQELSEHFEDIGRRTIAPGVVLGRVVSIDTSKNNAKIAVDVDVPAESDHQRTFFDKPKSWDRGYAFVRFVEGYGYMRSNFAAMIEDGVEVKVKRQEDDYEIVVPKNTAERAKNRLAWVTTPLRKIADEFDPSEAAVMLPLSFIGAWFGIWFMLGLVLSGGVGVLSFMAAATGMMGAFGGLVAAVILGASYFDW